MSTSHPTRRTWLLLAAALALSLPHTAAAREPAPVPEPVRIAVTAQPLPGFEVRDPARRRFGKLQFRGGLVLTSTHKDFGGISALRVDADGGRFLALTDKGQWLQGRIRYAGEAPAAIEDAEMAPMRGPDGRSIRAHGWYDTESLALDGGIAYVGVERVHRILRFDYGREGLRARGRPIPVPPQFAELPGNGGIESLVAVPKGLPLAGTLIAISERGLDAAGNIRAFLVRGRRFGEFAITRSEGFDITDAAVTPRGDLLVLERSFSPLNGAGMRIRRVPLAAVRPGAMVAGEVLVVADFAYQIDNMEGLSVHRGPAGETVLTVISDDNFSPLQRTLLLQFTLVE